MNAIHDRDDLAVHLRHGVRRFIAALSGEIYFAVYETALRSWFCCGYRGPMNWPVQGGDESPHSKLSVRRSEVAAYAERQKKPAGKIPAG